MSVPVFKPPAMSTATGHWTPEGPIWDAKREVFWYTDIEGGTLHKYSPAKGVTTTYVIAAQKGDKDGQMIGGTTALNSDGSLIVILEDVDKHGAPCKHSGVCYFNPDANNGQGSLLALPNTVSDTELAKPQNRPNDSTIITIKGDTGKPNRKLMAYGTMSKTWNDPAKVHNGAIKPEGGFYVLDEDMMSHRLKFKGDIYPGTVISNGLADGGVNPDGTTTLYFSETVDAKDSAGIGDHSSLRVYKGKLDPNSWTVNDIKVVAENTQLLKDSGAGEVRPDGANMVVYKGKPTYGIAGLGTGEIRLFDAENDQHVATIQLPDDVKNVTKFAVADDGRIFVTTMDFGYSNPEKKGTDGRNGHTFLLAPIEDITAHPAASPQTSYYGMQAMKEYYATTKEKPTTSFETPLPPPSTRIALRNAKVGRVIAEQQMGVI